MPQHAKGPRLYRRPDSGIWIIRDTGRGDHSTGRRDRGEAEAELARYLAERTRRPGGPASPDELTIAEALALYGEEHAPTTKDPARIGYALAPLLAWWGARSVSAITKETCRAYGRDRRKPGRRDRETGEVLEWLPIAAGTVRKELGTLAAALHYARDEGRLLNPPRVHLPPKPDSRERWLTRQEAAALVWAAWRNPASRHLARFILVALYTGTRKQAILGLRFMPHVSGGWVDTDRAVMYRRAEGQRETKKRQPPVPIPPRLLSHLRRWKRHQKRWVVEFKGAGVGSIRTAWHTAVEAAGLEATGVTPHSLRHTAITWAMQTGAASVWELAGYFGVDPETLHKTYAHHHPDHQKGAVAAISAGGRKGA